MRQLILLIKTISGGGAERIITLLGDTLAKKGFQVTLIITHQRREELRADYVNPDITVITLENEIKPFSQGAKKLRMLWIRLRGKINRVLHPGEESAYLVEKYSARNGEKVAWLKRYFARHPKATAIAFLYDSIYLTLLSAKKSNKVIISERGDPQQCLSSKTNLAFFSTMFRKADEMVFQSPDVMQWYRENANVTGRVIFNPVKLGLPERYRGERKKKIVNFCRISSQKNLHLLLKAFAHFFKEYPEYDLYIYGDAVGNGTEGYVESINESIDKLKCKNKIHILPGQENIHNLVKDYAMFVSSSDYEGMSNSMLEAMAIGLPTICTDCPAGGARAVIRDHENGILVPVGDVQAMADAMKEVAANPDLAEKLSENGVKIRDDLSVDKIVNQWMEIIDG